MSECAELAKLRESNEGLLGENEYLHGVCKQNTARLALLERLREAVERIYPHWREGECYDTSLIAALRACEPKAFRIAEAPAAFDDMPTRKDSDPSDTIPRAPRCIRCFGPTSARPSRLCPACIEALHRHIQEHVQ